jgi:RNA polymerase sigma-70 factor (ECF subfamily)
LELNDNHEIPYEIDYIVKEETLRLLEEAVEKLPSQTKEVIKRSMKGMTVQQVADSLEISVNTVKTLKSRAYRILKDSYGNIFALLISTYFYNL